MKTLVEMRKNIDELKEKINSIVVIQRQDGKASEELLELSRQLDFLIVEYIKRTTVS